MQVAQGHRANLIALPSLTMTAVPKIPHAQAAARFVADADRTTWHDQALWHVRQKRDKAAHGIPEWEDLRQRASDIKDHALSELDVYLEQFEAAALANGVQVHWASDAEEHNRIIHEILKRKKIREVVKSKSMLTEECGLNPYLEDRGIEVVDTDLGERIIQMLNEPPSHIVMPAIHLKKEEIGELFHAKLGTEQGSADPQYLTEAARQHLRSRFLVGKAAITGVNFGVAETGTVTVCTNEGNADMGVHLAEVQIHCMGIEKVIPRWEDLGVFTRLLGRSATGQPITIYTSHHHRPRPGAEMHVVIVDNGRSEHLGREDFRNALKCIRCGACMNTCPIYRRSGGHSYGSTIPGPIGSILTPGFDLEQHNDLPFASTLCGSCSDVCPVKIDIHDQLYKWRQVATDAGHMPWTKRLAMRGGNWVLSRRTRLGTTGKLARAALRVLPKGLINNPLNDWGKARDMPEPPKQTFSEWYAANRRDEG